MDRTRTIPYWNPADLDLIDDRYESDPTVGYFRKYHRQLDLLPHQRRFTSMYFALQMLYEWQRDPTMVEFGTLHDDIRGGVHSSYKLGECCWRLGGRLHSADVSVEAVAFSRRATQPFWENVRHHLADPGELLAAIDGAIDLVYVAGGDGEPGPPGASARRQVQTVATVLPRLAERGVVIVEHAGPRGVGGAADPTSLLVDHGFKLAMDVRQQVYVRHVR